MSPSVACLLLAVVTGQTVAPTVPEANSPARVAAPVGSSDGAPAVEQGADVPGRAGEGPETRPTEDRSVSVGRPPRPSVLPPVTAYENAKRPVPDYDGRPTLPPSAGEVFSWVPRIALYPAHLFAEYALRRPVVSLVRWSEVHHVKERVYDALTWNDNRGGVYPIASVDLGLKQTLGVRMYWGGLPVDANEVRLSVYGATQGVFGLYAEDHLKVFRDGTGTVHFGASYVTRPDGVFYGLGPDTVTSDKTFYSFHARDLHAGLKGDLGGLNHTFLKVGYRQTDFGGSTLPGSPNIETRFGGLGQPPLPPGFSGYRLFYAHAGLVLDTRDPRIDLVPSGSGVRLQPDLIYALDPAAISTRFLTWGATGGAFYDVSGARHVLGIELGARFVERLGETDVPFTELPSLGGMPWMRGFLGGRLRGESALVASAQYRYAFWTFLDAELFASLGNCFNGHWQGFAFDRLFADTGLALRSSFSRDTSITLTLAFGSTRLDAAEFRLFDTTRVSIGVLYGF